MISLEFEFVRVKDIKTEMNSLIIPIMEFQAQLHRIGWICELTIFLTEYVRADTNRAYLFCSIFFAVTKLAQY